MSTKDHTQRCRKGSKEEPPRKRRSCKVKDDKKSERRDVQDNCSSEDESTRSYTDFICPICLELLIKPVVLPCFHELCMPCFQSHISDTSLHCPMCRKRISVWARHKKKEGNFVDEKRWALIQTLFPERCRRRLNGEDDIYEEDFAETNPMPALAQTGEIRKEYEKELEKVRQEQMQESLASEEIIRKLQEEERILVQSHSQQEKEDENLALQLQEEEVRQIQGVVTNPSDQEKKIIETFNSGIRKMSETTFKNQNALLHPQSSNHSKYVSNLRIKDTTKTSRLHHTSTGHTSPNSNSSGIKENIGLSKWFTKEGSSCSSGSDISPRSSRGLFLKLQEDSDRDFALQIQKRLDEETRLPKISKIEDHFYPLRSRDRNTSDSGLSKKRIRLR